MKKVLLTAAVISLIFASNSFAGSWGNSETAYANIDQGQYQVQDTSTSWVPFGMATNQTGEQGQWNSGVVKNGDGAAYQFQTQADQSNYSTGTWFGYMDHSAGQEMTGENYGNANWRGSFGSDSGQYYDANMTTQQIGPNIAVSGISESFGQQVSGYAIGCADVGNYVQLNAGNQYQQGANNGNDWVNHSGGSEMSAGLGGDASTFGFYGGSVEGYQNGGTVTAQDGIGQFQSGNQSASAGLSVEGFDIGFSNVSGGGGMSQFHTYEQFNQGNGGSQYQTGYVSTNINVNMN